MSVRTGPDRGGSNRVWRKLLLAVGFIAVAIGTIVAWQSPATGYEVSVYAGTPLIFWVGVSIGFLSAATVTLASCRDRIAGVSVGLGALTAIAIGSLPVIRSYRFYGRADSMTHLGWAADLMSGRMRFGDLFYPGGHSTTTLLADSMGLPIERAMILFAALYFALHVAFIPLVAKALFEDGRLTVIAAFSGFMMLPINQISSGLYFHTYSMATLFFPVFLYALVKHLTSKPKDGPLIGRIGAWNIVIAVLGAVLVITHPQLALNVVILLGTLVVLHLVFRNRRNLFVSNLRPVYGVFVFIGVCWVVWVVQFGRVFDVGERVMLATYDTLFGAAQAGGGNVGSQVDSARSVEATLFELFVKLFLVPAVYSLLGTLAVVVSLRTPLVGTDRSERATEVEHRGRSVVTYFGSAGLVLGPFFLAHFMGPVSHLFFRHYGFAMVFVAVLGAAMIHRLGTLIPTGRWLAVAKPLALGLLAVALVLSLLTLFASPYMYNASHHVTDQHMSGYEAAIEYRGEDVQWSGIRRGPGREFDALVPGVGLYTRPAVSTGVSTRGDDDLRLLLEGAADEARYLPVSRSDIDREVTAYRELRYSESMLESIGSRSGVHHVHDNGEFDLYYVTPRNNETATGGAG
ncbi:hypothetical protein [Halorubrum salsamenti]|uniref:hypothetical protein n=1 Tax=Halorubrum salsamenti TaxID=2583990 RepID=UPI0011A6F7DA|nr:hypothetical protein [Halorubrum salsamenti]